MSILLLTRCFHDTLPGKSLNIQHTTTKTTATYYAHTPPTLIAEYLLKRSLSTDHPVCVYEYVHPCGLAYHTLLHRLIKVIAVQITVEYCVDWKRRLYVQIMHAYIQFEILSSILDILGAPTIDAK
jgi:hypothetical protein